MDLRRNIRHWHRALPIALCAVLVAALSSVGAASAALADCETLWVRTYDVSMETDRKVYRVGDTVTIDVTVTRSDTGMPVEDAAFFGVVDFEDARLVGADKTDAAGHALTKLRLRRKYVDLGPTDLYGWAAVTVGDTMCATVIEYGEEDIRNAFRIER